MSPVFFHHGTYLYSLFGPRVFIPPIEHRGSAHRSPAYFQLHEVFLYSRFHLGRVKTSPQFPLQALFFCAFRRFYGTSTLSLPCSSGCSLPVEQLNQYPTWRLILRWELPVSSPVAFHPHELDSPQLI